MKKISSLFVLLLSSISSILYGQQHQEVTLQNFSKIDVQGIMQVELVKSKVNKVTSEALNGANLEDLTVAVSGDELSVKTKIFKQLTDQNNNKKITGKKQFKITIEYTNELAGIIAGRGVELNADEALTGNHLVLDASSGAIVKLDMNVNNLVVSSVQGAIVTLDGKAAFLQAKVNTGGELFAYQLKSDEADVKANTGGVAEISANNTLDASASTGGTISYKGKPNQQTIKKTLGGEIHAN